MAIEETGREVDLAPDGVVVRSEMRTTSRSAWAVTVSRRRAAADDDIVLAIRPLGDWLGSLRGSHIRLTREEAAHVAALLLDPPASAGRGGGG